jgi:hypothetical protein
MLPGEERPRLTFHTAYGIVREMENTQSTLERESASGQTLMALDPKMSVAEALELLRRVPGEAMPVIRPENGEVLGVLARGLSYFPPAPPPRLGGMATPLGVYLTDGVSAGGAGFWGLFLSGVTLGGLGLVAQALVQGGSTLLAHFAPHLMLALPAQTPGPLRVWLTQMGADAGPILLIVILLLVLLRCLPMAGTHAAEHQVVHCIERGLPLQPACVRAMPRVHPRCGTNLVVGLLLFRLVFVAVWSAVQTSWAPMDAATLALIVAAPVALAYWRRLGGWVQYWLATRPATDRQIAGAIAAAKQVLRRRDEHPALQATRFRFARRVWSMGLAQVMSGYAALYGSLLLTVHFWPHLGDLLGF